MTLLDKFRLDGQVAVVTGSGRGIGQGIAEGLAEAGAAVVVAARRTHEIEAVADGIRRAGGKALAVTTDFLDVEQIEALADAAVSASTAVSRSGSTTSAVPRTARPARSSRRPRRPGTTRSTSTLKSVWAGARAAARAMGDTGGVIVNISSAASTKPSPMNGPYAAAKLGVDSLTLTLAAELAPGIRVVGVSPGPGADRSHD